MDGRDRLCRYMKIYFREGQGRDAVLITLTTELKSGQHPVVRMVS